MAGEGAQEMAGHWPLVINGPAFFGCTGGKFKSHFSSGDVSNVVNCGDSSQARGTGSSQNQAAGASQASQAVNTGPGSGETTENGEGHNEHPDQGVQAEVDIREQSSFAELDPNTSDAPGYIGRQALSKVPAGSFSPPIISSPPQSAVDKVKVHVSNLPPSMTGKQLRTLFEPFGPVREYKIWRDENTGASRGCGFIKYSRAEEAEKATRCMDGHVIEGHKLVVEVAGGRRQTDWARESAANGPFSRLPPSPLAARRKGPPELTGYAATSPQRTGRGADLGPFNRQPDQDFPSAGSSNPPFGHALQAPGAPYYAPPPHYEAVASATQRPPLYGGYSRAGELPHQYSPPFLADRHAAEDYGAPAPGGQRPTFQAPPLPASHFLPPFSAPFSGGQHPQYAHPSPDHDAAPRQLPPPYHAAPFAGNQHGLYAYPDAPPQYGAPPLALGAAPAAGSHPPVKEVAEGGGSTDTPGASSHDSDAHLSAACETEMSVYKVVKRRSVSEASCDAATIENTAARLARAALNNDSTARNVGSLQHLDTPSSRRTYSKVPQESPNQQHTLDDVIPLGQPAERHFSRRAHSEPPDYVAPAVSEPPAAAASEGMMHAYSEESEEDSPPTLTACFIEGTFVCGETLVAEYTYEGGEEGDHRMTWYCHEDEDDPGTPIPGSIGRLSLVLTHKEVGRLISFRCTPVRADGVEGRREWVMERNRVKPSRAYEATSEEASLSLRDLVQPSRAGVELRQERGAASGDFQFMRNKSTSNRQRERSWDALRRVSKLQKRAREERDDESEVSVKRAHRHGSEDETENNQRDTGAAPRRRTRHGEKDENKLDSCGPPASNSSAGLANDDDLSGQNEGDPSAAQKKSTGGSAGEGSSLVSEPEDDFPYKPLSSSLKPRMEGRGHAIDQQAEAETARRVEGPRNASTSREDSKLVAVKGGTSAQGTFKKVWR